MSSNHLILCHSLLLPPSIFPSIRVFSNEPVLRIRWPEYWSLSFSITPSNEDSGFNYYSLLNMTMPYLSHYVITGQYYCLYSSYGHWFSRVYLLLLSSLYPYHCSYSCLPGSAVDKNSPANAGTQVQSLVQEESTRCRASKSTRHSY